MIDPNQHNDLTDGWPDEPGKSEVEAFARNLLGHLPELPPEAMQRIGGQMHDEMALERWRKRRLRAVAAITVAASVLIGIVIWRAIDATAHKSQVQSDPVAMNAAPPVRDQYRVPVLATPVAPATDPVALLSVEEQKRMEKAPASTKETPLLAVDSHRSLFANE